MSARAAAQSGIDNALASRVIDAIVAPHLSNATAPAVSGYPSIALPIGITAAGKPAGMLMYAGYLDEPELIARAYDLEQAMGVRRQPQMPGQATDPPDAGLCNGGKAEPKQARSESEGIALVRNFG